MTDLTSYHEQLIINRNFGAVDADPAPATVYMALHTGPPTNTGTENEVTAADYSRIAVQNPSQWSISGNTAENLEDIEFGIADSAWGEVTHATLWDGPNAADDPEAPSNPLWHTQLEVSKLIEENDEMRFSPGFVSYEIN
jgi:hypothetical protein